MLSLLSLKCPCLSLADIKMEDLRIWEVASASNKKFKICPKMCCQEDWDLVPIYLLPTPHPNWLQSNQVFLAFAVARAFYCTHEVVS